MREVEILEKYGIYYIVLEIHAIIAPQLGASLALLPHGSQILDQPGCYDTLERIGMPMEHVKNFGPGGRSLLPKPHPLGSMMRELLVWYLVGQFLQ
jgi:hypothetical protein